MSEISSFFAFAHFKLSKRVKAFDLYFVASCRAFQFWRISNVCSECWEFKAVSWKNIRLPYSLQPFSWVKGFYFYGEANGRAFVKIAWDRLRLVIGEWQRTWPWPLIQGLPATWIAHFAVCPGEHFVKVCERKVKPLNSAKLKRKKKTKRSDLSNMFSFSLLSLLLLWTQWLSPQDPALQPAMPTAPQMDLCSHDMPWPC